MAQYLCRFNTCFSPTNGFRNVDDNNLNGTLYIGNISSLNRKLHNGIIDGHLQSLSLMKNDISYVDYNSSDIHDVTIAIMQAGFLTTSKTNQNAFSMSFQFLVYVVLRQNVNFILIYCDGILIK